MWQRQGGLRGVGLLHEHGWPVGLALAHTHIMCDPGRGRGDVKQNCNHTGGCVLAPDNNMLAWVKPHQRLQVPTAQATATA